MKRALCIGVNYEGTGHELRGCINDCKDWANLFYGKGYATQQITEKEGTREFILQAIAMLIDDLNKAGETGFLTFSGHGTWLPDMDGDEPDGRDEALVPYDVGNGERLIMDDELGEIFSRLRPDTRLVFISDCCHSGSAYRLVQGLTDERRTRFLPPHYFNMAGPGAYMNATRSYGMPAPTAKALPGVIHLAGCRDTEFAADAKILGRYCGAFSFHLLKAFQDAHEYGWTFAQVHKWMRRYLPSNDYQQTPQLNATAKMKATKVFT